MAKVTLDLSKLRTLVTIFAFWDGEARQQITESDFMHKEMKTVIKVESVSISARVPPSTTTTQCATFPSSISSSPAVIIEDSFSMPSAIDRTITFE
ncbi:hypothetical protein OGAPHI_004124 [Ogataea philodendri]|uniref:Uncharacterized protein n=1 Tax=Ogataea philodendri TaxID=1378263 RepID=A0A9P8P6G9_9ASCO|nr:uncharacterized protein OGAPHI_004124 [Ogataea philodendri]KAH3665935.1 hypothetical protein OGAPHI_004124 [Ogataea philodendri]